MMRQQALNDQLNAALAQSRALHRMLAAELGTKPDGQMWALYRRIHEGKDWHVLAPGNPHNLPILMVPLAGQEKELDEIYAHLQESGCRLLNLVAPGSSGRNRLALNVAADLVAARPGPGSMCTLPLN